MKTSPFKVACLFLLFGFALSAQAQTVINAPETNSAAVPAAVDVAPAPPITINADPWQSYNRTIFSFNLKADKYFLKPLAKAYVKLTPVFFRQGVANIFSNILEVPSALNSVLQGKLSHATHNSGRLLINTTLGVAGLFDVAQHMGLQNLEGEDFGQTLAVWGVKSGPYIMLPILGPSTLRDTIAWPVDWYSDPIKYIDHVPTSNTVLAVSLLNTRAGYLPLEKSIIGDKYIFIRDVYLQRRNYLINDGVVEDSFGSSDSGDGDSY